MNFSSESAQAGTDWVIGVRRPIRQRHQRHATQARLDTFTHRIRFRAHENRGELRLHCLEGQLNGQDLVADAEIARDQLGIGQPGTARKTRAYGDAHDCVRAERVHREHGGVRGGLTSTRSGRSNKSGGG